FRWMYSDSRYGWGQNYAAGTYDLSNNWVEYTIPGGMHSDKEGTFPLTHSRGDSNRTEFRLRNASNSLPIVIPPGEALVFTMRSNQPLVPNQTNVYDMAAGFRNFGFYVDADQSFQVPREEFDRTEYSGVFVDIRSRKDNVCNDSMDVGGF